MTDSRDEMDGGARSPGRSRAANVLADRMAAALLHHEPGWRLPRYTALARRYNVRPAEVESAIEELSARHLLTRLPDGQVFRASPAEYRLVLEGLPGFGTHVDPMGGELRCKGRTISMRRAPEDIVRAVGAPGDMALTIRSLWTVGGEPAAHSVTYLPPSMEGLVSEFASATSPAGPPPGSGRPCAFQVQVQPPPPSVARSLRLTAGEAAATITIRFENSLDRTVIALAVAVLRPDLFRIVVESRGAPPIDSPDGSTAWTHAFEEGET